MKNVFKCLMIISSETNGHCGSVPSLKNTFKSVTELLKRDRTFKKGQNSIMLNCADPKAVHYPH